MPIIVTSTVIPDVLVIEPKVFGDDRGWFYESFNENDFSKAVGKQVSFVQDNHSLSKKGVLRGLHYQIQQPQGKLVRVIKGRVLDVVVDMRKSSQNFGKWVGVELSSENKKQLWIPEGFAHGFMVLSQEDAEVAYKTTSYWASSDENALLWNDKYVNIAWPMESLDPILSQKDRDALDWERAPKFQ
jgi:dTDP-4-dehydrorhamnose 3,5-epimerase